MNRLDHHDPTAGPENSAHDATAGAPETLSIEEGRSPPPLRPTPPPRTAPVLRFDWRDWLPYLEEEDIPEEQKREMIENLWLIVVAFVDFGWSVKSETQENEEHLDLKAILTAAARQTDGADDGSGSEAA